MPLPKHVFRVVKPSGRVYFYYQKNRGREDAGDLVRLPDDPTSPLFWRAVEEIAAPPGPKAGTVSALIAAFKVEPRYLNLSKSTRRVYDLCLGHIETAWGEQAVETIQPKHIYALMARLSATPSMANMVRSVLSVLLMQGVRAGLVERNAARDVQEYDEAGEGSEPWPEDVFAFVIEKAPPLVMRAAVLARSTGQRGVDLVKLRPADRKDAGFDMLIQKLKNKRHWCPVAQDALAAIDGWGQEKMIPYLHIANRKIKEDTIRKHWAAFRDANPDRIPGDLTLHDLRASAVCDRRLRGVPHQQIVDQIGMSLNMVMTYSKAIDKTMNAQAGMAAMERAGNGPMQTVYAAIENRKG